MANIHKQIKEQSESKYYEARRTRKANKLKGYVVAVQEKIQNREPVKDLEKDLYELDLNYLKILDQNHHLYSHGNLKEYQKKDHEAYKHYKNEVEEVMGSMKKASDLERTILKHRRKSLRGDTKVENKEIKSRLEQIAAVVLIVIGASIILSTNATITTYSVIPEYKDQGRFFIVGILLIALGIFFPSLAFIKNLIKKSKNKNSIINKKKKKSKK